MIQLKNCSPSVKQHPITYSNAVKQPLLTNFAFNSNHSPNLFNMIEESTLAMLKRQFKVVPNTSGKI